MLTCRQLLCPLVAVRADSSVTGKHNEMVSFGEKRAMRYVKDDPLCLLRHNFRQMTRVYPTGARFDSSNFDPVPLWNTGCQFGKSASVLSVVKGKVFPYSLPSVGPGADPGVQAVSPQVT